MDVLAEPQRLTARVLELIQEVRSRSATADRVTPASAPAPAPPTNADESSAANESAADEPAAKSAADSGGDLSLIHI